MSTKRPVGRKVMRRPEPPPDLMSAVLSSGPIIRRELVALLRSRRAFLTAAATVALTGLVPLLTWPEQGAPGAADHARRGFHAYLGAFAAAMVLFTAVTSASAVTTEREEGTWDLLLASPIPPAGIILGKLVSHLAFFLILIALTFPVAAVLFLLGGFEAEEMGWGVSYMTLNVTVVGASGIYQSLRKHRTIRAIISTLAFAVFSFHPVGLIFGVLTLFLLFRDLRRGQVPEPTMPWSYSRSRHPLFREETTIWPIPRILRASRKGIPDRWNPVLVLSSQNEVVRTLGMPDLGCLIFGVMLFLLPLSAMSENRLHLVVIFTGLLLGAMVLVFPGLAAVLLSAEREMERLDHLRTTPLGAREVLGGKLTAVLLTGVLALFLGTFAMPIVLFEPHRGFLSIPLYFYPAALSVGLVTATAGLLGAALSRTTLQALVISYLLAGAYLVGPVIGEALVGQAGTWPSPLTGYVWNGGQVSRGSGSQGWREMASAISIAMLVAGAQFSLAAAVFERRWLRGR